MHRIIAMVAFVSMAVSAALAQDGVRRLLYVSNPDGAGGKGPKGIFVYDIDNGHKLVKVIEADIGGSRGMCANAAVDKLWCAHNNDKLFCLDLRTEKVLWEITHDPLEGGFDRIGVTPDGKKVYAPSGWWSGDPHVKVLDGATGEMITKIKVAPKGGVHNLIVSRDGKRVYAGSIRHDHLVVIDTATDTVIKEVGPLHRAIQPLTINGSQTLAYINTHVHRDGLGIGFEVGDLNTGEVRHVVKIDGLEHRKDRCHGIGLTPDETEVWLVDQNDRNLHIFDNTVAPPKFKQTVKVADVVHGWICFSRDGQYAWYDTGEVFDVKTKRVVARLTSEPDGKGKPIMSSKFVEIHVRGDDPVWVGRQMGVGYVGSPD